MKLKTSFQEKLVLQREAHERKVEAALHAYRIGEAIKHARLKENLTQEELGARLGVQKAQISRMERGYSISIPTMICVFKALGIATATLDLGVGGKIALWQATVCWLKSMRTKKKRVSTLFFCSITKACLCVFTLKSIETYPRFS